MSHVTSFVVDCKLLDTQILHVGVAHCYKEANKCVGTPAKMGFLPFEAPPSKVIDVFNFDDVVLYSNGFCLGTFDVP